MVGVGGFRCRDWAYFFGRVGGWLVGWLVGNWKVKLISTQVVGKVGVELVNEL